MAARAIGAQNNSWWRPGRPCPDCDGSGIAHCCEGYAPSPADDAEPKGTKPIAAVALAVAIALGAAATAYAQSAPPAAAPMPVVPPTSDEQRATDSVLQQYAIALAQAQRNYIVSQKELSDTKTALAAAEKKAAECTIPHGNGSAPH